MEPERREKKINKTAIDTWKQDNIAIFGGEKNGIVFPVYFKFLQIFDLMHFIVSFYPTTPPEKGLSTSFVGICPFVLICPCFLSFFLFFLLSFIFKKKKQNHKNRLFRMTLGAMWIFFLKFNECLDFF